MSSSFWHLLHFWGHLHIWGRLYFVIVFLIYSMSRSNLFFSGIKIQLETPGIKIFRVWHSSAQPSISWIIFLCSRYVDLVSSSTSMTSINKYQNVTNILLDFFLRRTDRPSYRPTFPVLYASLLCQCQKHKNHMVAKTPIFSFTWTPVFGTPC